MILDIISFLKLSFGDILDIFLTALIIYYAFKWIRGTSAMSILVAIISLFVFKVVVSALGMKMMTEFMNIILDVGVLAIIVIFQPEIRRFLIRFGQRYALNEKVRNFFDKLLKKNRGRTGGVVQEIASACSTMSESKTGALIVIAKEVDITDIVDTGDIIDAKVSQRLLMNLFFKNSPLHDGAVIINNSRIVAARCTLPISDNQNLPAKYGMRHKAAIGISEVTDADVIVVSEETGSISFIREGKVKEIHNPNELKLLLNESI